MTQAINQIQAEVRKLDRATSKARSNIQSVVELILTGGRPQLQRQMYDTIVDIKRYHELQAMLRAEYAKRETVPLYREVEREEAKHHRAEAKRMQHILDVTAGLIEGI